MKWEGFDASVSALRKQSDYNEAVRDSDMFLALFHTKAGEFTLEEFEVALAEFSKSKVKPKIYTYFKELENGQTEESSLVEFKKKLMDEIGHYYCRYGNPDTMMLHFVLQIKVLDLDAAPEVKVEDSQVTIDGKK